MKKIIPLLLVVFLFSCNKEEMISDNIRGQKYKKTSDEISENDFDFSFKKINTDLGDWTFRILVKEREMDYVIYHDENSGGVCSINLTKDSLEVELLKRQLKN